MKRFTLILSLMVAMVTTAIAGDLVGSTADAPVYFKMKNLNDNYVKANAVNGDVATAGKFAFYAVGDVENAYYIYSADESKWFNYTIADGYDNKKGFISLTEEKGNYFNITACTRNGNAGYQIAPYNNNGVAGKYLNYFQGADNTNTLGLWQQGGADDNGSCWILEEWVEVTEVEPEPLTTDYYYQIVNRNSGKFLSYANNKSTIADNGDADAQLWALVADGEQYKLMNKEGVYVVHTTAGNTCWTVSAEIAQGTSFTIGVQQKGTSAPTPAYYYFSYDNSDQYACMHEAGWPNADRVVKWEAASASSQWELRLTEVEVEDVAVFNVTYNFVCNDVTLATQTEIVEAGAEFPAFNVTLPLGYRIAEEKPAGNVTATASEEITVVVDNSLLPFEAVEEGTPTTWYYAQMHYYTTSDYSYRWFIAPAEDGSSVRTQDHEFAANEVDAHLWGFVGTVEGGFKMVNKATGKAIKSANTGVAAMAEVADATAFIAMGSKLDADWFCMKNPAGNYLNSQGSAATANNCDFVINHWSDNDGGSSFFLTKYAAENVTVAISGLGVATNYFTESVHVPAGVEAYIITGAEEGYVVKEQIAEGEVIPANTGVLLAGEGEIEFAKTVSFNYTLEGNLLRGTAEDTYVEGAAYVLANHAESGLGFYVAALNKNATGEEGTTHFLNNAGKAYLVLPATSTAAFYGFDWAGTTGIEGVEVENTVKAIFDLTGRRVEAISAPGIYIVNGKKVLVK